MGWILDLWHYFFFPAHQPWYDGAVWSNVVAVIPCGILGWIWSRTRFWPLCLFHKKLDRLAEGHEAIHQRLDTLHERHEELLKALQADDPDHA